MSMTILDFRIILSLILVFMIGVAMLCFFIRKNPIMKIINLAFAYILSIIFLLYILIIKSSEDILFPIFIIIFINFLLTFITGVSILNNLLNSGDEYEYESD